MRIPQFRIENQRSLRLAECAVVPRLMVVAGPNGAGKSTLLNALRTAPGQGPILYVGPHRNTRRQVVQWKHLLSGSISLENILAMPSIPGYEGLQFMSNQRDAWSFDEAANYLKHGLCQIEVERKDAIASRYDKDGEIPKGLPDPWTPLRELTANLLPHLSFDKIDATNRSQMRVLWRVHANDMIVDLDDLSSGEKSIIQIFYPLLEDRIKAILRRIQRSETANEHPEITVLIDEPELHLHPNLQVKVFDYLRLLSSGGRTQFIIATHSPTIVEYASFDELFLLRAVETVAPGENQLIQVAGDEERLRFLREVFGTTSNLTAQQPIVVVEGVDQTGASRTVSDRKLYRALHPGFDRVTLVAGGGKSECIRLRETLHGALQSLSSTIRAVALLDRDLAAGSPPTGVTYLPVSMIENFLLDPQAIWTAIQSVVEKTDFRSVDNVEAALDVLLDKLTVAEVERRTIAALGRRLFQAKAPLETISKQAEDFARELVAAASSEKVALLKGEIERQVGALKSSSARRENFDGKEVLARFFKAHLHATGMSTGIFRYETARHARDRQKVVKFFDSFFTSALPEVNAPRVATPDTM